MQAKSTGAAVPVESSRTAYSETVANPDGSYAFSSTLQPQRARKGQGWATPDAKLRANADGTVAPVASVSGLTLSGGGTGPLAVLDDGAGHKLAVSMPMRLPRPRLDGDTATYPGVLPGVDLQVTATVQGGLSEVLVVHDAAAAANPALARLRLATAAQGLQRPQGAQARATGTGNTTHGGATTRR
ncbi:hypothetical protein ACPPVO_43455 [Dactylosporangium sp. McL0621]|uniref:hypothetical protein n=1 Tax=Dactylosporangium sp. McL0621 TaxID=3415678 RepID=UPI003CF33BB4